MPELPDRGNSALSDSNPMGSLSNTDLGARQGALKSGALGSGTAGVKSTQIQPHRLGPRKDVSLSDLQKVNQ